MAGTTYTDVLRLVEELTPDERLRLIAHLAMASRHTAATPMPRPKWSDLLGVVPSPALGEDAQAWVSRTRQESDESRERHQRDMP